MNMHLLEVAMCEKCRSSHFQSEGGVKKLRTGVVVGGEGILGLERTFTVRVSAPLHAMILHNFVLVICPSMVLLNQTQIY